MKLSTVRILQQSKNISVQHTLIFFIFMDMNTTLGCKFGARIVKMLFLHMCVYAVGNMPPGTRKFHILDFCYVSISKFLKEQ